MRSGQKEKSEAVLTKELLVEWINGSREAMWNMYILDRPYAVNAIRYQIHRYRQILAAMLWEEAGRK